MPSDNFKLRELQPSDSSALEKLVTEFDGDMTTRFLIDGYEAIIFGTEFCTSGVVAEFVGYDGLVGMGTVRFGKVQYYGEILPFAFLDGLKVHKDFRGRGKKPNGYFVAVDGVGNLLAGAQTWARGMLKSDTINNPPALLRLLNHAARVLPGDFVIHDVAVSGLWYQPGQEKVAGFLWEMIRWKCKELGTTIVASLDPRDPAREIVTLKPWHQPRPKITLAIHGPMPVQREKLIFGHGRI